MDTVQDVTACVAQDNKQREYLSKYTNHIVQCDTCGKTITLTIGQLKQKNAGKKVFWCSDKCCTADIDQKAQLALDHLREVVGHFNEAADSYKEYVEREMTMEKMPDIAPDPYFD